MKKFLFAGFGFLFCGVALAGVSNALTVETNPCLQSNSAKCRNYKYYKTVACRYSRCHNTSYSKIHYRPSAVRRNKTITKTVYLASYVKQPTSGSHNYNQTFDAKIASTDEGNDTYLITPTNTSGATWSWNYNSKSVLCDIVQENSLRCVKDSEYPPSEITADFTVKGKSYTSNVINL